MLFPCQACSTSLEHYTSPKKVSISPPRRVFHLDKVADINSWPTLLSVPTQNKTRGTLQTKSLRTEALYIHVFFSECQVTVYSFQHCCSWSNPLIEKWCTFVCQLKDPTQHAKKRNFFRDWKAKYKEAKQQQQQNTTRTLRNYECDFRKWSILLSWFHLSLLRYRTYLLKF